MLIASEAMKEIRNLKSMLQAEFEMKDLGDATVILGMEINRNKVTGSIVLRQQSYLEKVLESYNISMCKAVATPLK